MLDQCSEDELAGKDFSVYLKC